VGRVSKAGNTAYTVKSLDRSIVMGQSVAQPGKAFLTVTVGVTHRKYKTLTIPCAQTQPCAIVGIDGISCPEPIPVTAENLSFTPAIGGTEGGVCTAVFTDVRYPYKSVTLRFYSLRLHEDGSSDADTSVSSDYNCILSDDARMIEVSATP
jgi:hypothetical protein